MKPRIEDPAESATGSEAPRLARAWERCRLAGLDPADTPPPAVADTGERLRRQRCMHGVLEATRIELVSLVRHIGGSGHVLLVTDAGGFILDYYGDRQFNDTARQLGLVLGACWSEQAMGVQAIGLCLADRLPVQITGAEHYRRDLAPLTGSSTPLFSPAGELLGGLHAVASHEQANPHTLALLRLTSDAIEKRVLLERPGAEQVVLQFHSRPELVGAPGEGLLLVDADDRIAGATGTACFHLGLAAIADLTGHTVSETFNIRCDELPHGGARAGPRAIYETRAGRRFYASLRPGGAGAAATQPTMRKRRPSRGRATPSRLDDLDLGDPTMTENIRRARRVLDHELPILIQGETGTGKEVFSKAMHEASSRAGRNYVAVNCASIPETLIESELFGYKGGAFTGASREGNRGKIVQADGGTLFLDEIGDMPLPLQGRLLRVLEEREVLPLGSNNPIKVDIRLVSATHRDLQQLIAEGTFREDLYYRLQGVTISLPPLRQRSDRRALIVHLLRLLNQGEAVTVEPMALDALDRYHWPGNIRQLFNVLRIALALREGISIRHADLPTEIREGTEPTPGAATGEARDREEATPVPREQGNPLQDAEREVLLAALERHYWNITDIARSFNVSRNTIYRKMKAHNIRPPRAR